jgi:hypothetical protein
MATLHIMSVEKLSNNYIFKVEMYYNGENKIDFLVDERLVEVINMFQDITYCEEFEMATGETIEQALENIGLTYAEIADEGEEFDVYLHKVTVSYGEVSCDIEGKFIQTFKTEKAAKNKALKIAERII